MILRAWWLLNKDLSVSLCFLFWSAFSAPSVNMLRLADTLVNGWTLKDEGSASHYSSFPISQDSAEHMQSSGCWGTHQKRQNVGSVTQSHWSCQNLGSDPVRTSSYGPLKSQSSWEQKRYVQFLVLAFKTYVCSLFFIITSVRSLLRYFYLKLNTTVVYLSHMKAQILSLNNSWIKRKWRFNFNNKSWY